MERARFFAILHFMRNTKRFGYDRLERMRRFYIFQLGYTLGYQEGR